MLTKTKFDPIRCVKILRTVYNMFQREIAEAIGVSYKTINEWCNEKVTYVYGMNRRKLLRFALTKLTDSELTKCGVRV